MRRPAKYGYHNRLRRRPKLKRNQSSIEDVDSSDSDYSNRAEDERHRCHHTGVTVYSPSPTMTPISHTTASGVNIFSN